MAGSQWWNIWTLASAQAEEIVPHTIQAAKKPQQGGHSQWGTIYTVAGPYATQADAQKAIGQYHGPPPGSGGPMDSPISGLSILPNLSSWFVRVGEILLGLVLIAVGVAKMTNAVPVATKVARTAGAVALA